jgi:hypothetical protein
MYGSSSDVRRARAELDCATISINSSGVYLRHRVAADSAWRARRRAVWMRHCCWLATFGALYFLIGHDLIAMTRSVVQASSAGVRQEVHALANGLKQLVRLRELPPDASETAESWAAAAEALEAEETDVYGREVLLGPVEVAPLEQ